MGLIIRGYDSDYMGMITSAFFLPPTVTIFYCMILGNSVHRRVPSFCCPLKGRLYVTRLNPTRISSTGPHLCHENRIGRVWQIPLQLKASPKLPQLGPITALRPPDEQA